MAKTYNISIIKGDGIGPEIVDEAIKVLNAVGNKFDITFDYKEYLMGGIAMIKQMIHYHKKQ